MSTISELREKLVEIRDRDGDYRQKRIDAGEELLNYILEKEFLEDSQEAQSFQELWYDTVE